MCHIAISHHNIQLKQLAWQYSGELSTHIQFKPINTLPNCTNVMISQHVTFLVFYHIKDAVLAYPSSHASLDDEFLTPKKAKSTPSSVVNRVSMSGQSSLRVNVACEGEFEKLAHYSMDNFLTWCFIVFPFCRFPL